MDVTELVQSKWLTAQEIKDSPTKTVVILGSGQQEEVLSTKGERYKALVVPVQIDGRTKDWRLNRTSIKKLAEKFGRDTQVWVGKPILLTTLMMQGGREGLVPV